MASESASTSSTRLTMDNRVFSFPSARFDSTHNARYQRDRHDALTGTRSFASMPSLDTIDSTSRR